MAETENFKQNITSQEAAVKPLKNAQLRAPVDFSLRPAVLFVLFMWLERLLSEHEWKEDGSHTKKCNDLLTLSF